MTYLKGNFMMDMIPLIPLQWISLPKNRDRLFYLIKTMRIVQGFILFDVRGIVRAVKKANRKEIKRICREDPVLADDKNVDNNNIGLVLKT